MTHPLPGAAIQPLGDRALLLVLSGDAEQCNRRIIETARLLADECRHDPNPPISDVVPAMTSLAVFFDPGSTGTAEIERRLLAALARVPPLDESARPGHVHVVPVTYDGPDLGEAAARLGLSPGELVRLHAARPYRVRFLGFAPGFAYLGPLDPALLLPRRSEPRPRVPAGTVAIAGDQTAIYPLDTPGGWHLIGHTTVRPFDPERNLPSLFAAGDEVRFEPVPG